MKGVIGKILQLMSPRERRRLVLVFSGLLVTAMLQVIGLASILPFLSVVTNQEMIMENQLLNWLYTTLGFTTVNRFMLFLGFLVLAILIISNTASAVVTWAVERFSWMRHYSISRRLLATYLHRPYEYFLNQNTSTFGRNILSETGMLVGGMILPSMELIANALVVLFIMVFLIIIDPILAMVVTVTLGCAYAAVYLLVRRKLAKIGREEVAANRERFKHANEAFGDPKTVKLLGAEDYFVESFSKHSFIFSDRVATGTIIQRIPRYALEMVAFGGLLMIVLYLIATQGDMAQALPLIGLYAFAGYRLMPALQNTFQAAAKVRFHIASLEAIHEALEGAEDLSERSAEPREKISPLSFDSQLELKDITFRYPGADKPVVESLSLAVKARSSVAFVGKTGSGKTTIADIILGLLTPEGGIMSVDGQQINAQNMPRWQRNLGYVPQDIYLRDDTVAQNIAFAEPKESIDMEKVLKTAKIANIHKFIVDELPSGYETVVGERGVRLSGGERQRIGIARALYYDPVVVVLDEATSALDSGTEHAVFEAIENISKAKTLIIIAHRLTTVRSCDVVYVLDYGKIIAKGTYRELIDTCEVFRKWAKTHA